MLPGPTNENGPGLFQVLEKETSKPMLLFSCFRFVHTSIIFRETKAERRKKKVLADEGHSIAFSTANDVRTKLWR
jgi:hypothetical protein